jgi:subtilase family serine protease
MMSVTRVFATAAALAALAVGGIRAGVEAQAATNPGPRMLTGSAVPFTSHARVLGTVAGTRELTIQVWLAPRTTAAAYATAVATPGSAGYGHYLSPNAFTARFGPTAATVAATGSWLRSTGFTHVSADVGRDYVTATASVARIDSVFRTTLKYYKPTAGASAGRHKLYANDSAIALPAGLAGGVLGVTGLDNAAPVQTDERLESHGTSSGATYPCSGYYGQHTIPHLLSQFGSTTYPTQVCGYSADQFRSVYGADLANSGTGQSIALVELGLAPGMFKALRLYAKSSALPAPVQSRYHEVSLGGTLTACGDPFDGEEQLDIESAYTMAPSAAEYVIGGDACDTGYAGLQGLFDADLKVLNGNGAQPLATIASNSWESGAEGQPAQYTTIEHAFLVRAAAEGVGMYFSSADRTGVSAPSSDPYAIAVGGTTLGIGKTGSRLFETGWSTKLTAAFGGTWNDQGIVDAAGGGPSLLWLQPAYQKKVVPDALARVAGDTRGLRRSVPDISADADPYTGMLVTLQEWDSTGNVYAYVTQAYGGTSLATPLVAGLVADAQQGQARSFGFIDPVLYKLAGTSAFYDTLPLTSASPVAYRGIGCDPFYCGSPLITEFDDQNWATPYYNGQVTLKGYDNMTGLGTPDGQTFINDLRHLPK